MNLPTQLLLFLFASAALSTFSATASTPEFINNIAPKNVQSFIGLNAANDSKAENGYTSSKLSTSWTMVSVDQLPNSDRVDWTYTIQAQPYGDYNLDNYHHSASGIQPLIYGPVVMSDLSVRQKVSSLIRDVPLPAAVWLFLGGLLGFLRIQRRPTNS